jgi:type IV pilus assembly protein PilO
MKRINLNELTFENIGVWPIAAKIMVVTLLAVGIIIGGFWLVVKPGINKLNLLQKDEMALKQDFEVKSEKAANLSGYKNQIADMQHQFSAFLQQLPNSAEIPNLIEDISKIGTSNGLEFKLIRPDPEVDKEFYKEMPIKIFVTGTYHQVSSFVSGVSALQRIVTFNNLTLAKAGTLKVDGSNVTVDLNAAKTTIGDKLDMEIEAKTYRYVDETKN